MLLLRVGAADDQLVDAECCRRRGLLGHLLGSLGWFSAILLAVVGPLFDLLNHAAANFSAGIVGDLHVLSDDGVFATNVEVSALSPHRVHVLFTSVELGTSEVEDRSSR